MAYTVVIESHPSAEVEQTIGLVVQRSTSRGFLRKAFAPQDFDGQTFGDDYLSVSKGDILVRGEGAQRGSVGGRTAAKTFTLLLHY